MIFVDTSALLAYLDRDAARHEDVVVVMADSLRRRLAVTHNYVIVETEALTHRRLGGSVARRLLEDVVPALEVAWVDPALHAGAVAEHLRSLRRRTSLVDHVSFELMRSRRIDSALAVDRHFVSEGFRVLP